MNLRKKVNWAQIFRASFLFLFLSYPGVSRASPADILRRFPATCLTTSRRRRRRRFASVKIAKLFRCVEVDGAYWLYADMRLQCYDSRWAGYALYGAVMAVLFTAGRTCTMPFCVCLSVHRALFY